MSYTFINKWSNFIVNETLKTNDIDFTIKNIDNELSLLGFNFSITKNKNTIELTINEFYSINNIIDFLIILIVYLLIEMVGFHLNIN